LYRESLFLLLEPFPSCDFLIFVCFSLSTFMWHDRPGRENSKTISVTGHGGP
jgi:hypothetical protein